MKKSLAFLFFCILLPCTAKGQYTDQKDIPDWVQYGYFTDLVNSYIEVVSANGYSEENARDNAIKQILSNRSIATGQRVSIEGNERVLNLMVEDELTVKARIKGQYCERLGAGQYKVSLLVQIAKNPEYEFEPVTLTTKYPINANILIPGMAQLQKGSRAKALMFISGEIAAIGGFVAFESLRNSYNKKIEMNHNTQIRQAYMSKANNMKNLRNGCLFGVMSIYIWNIIDGAIAEGKQHIVVGDATVNISSFSTNEATGLSLNLSF